MPLNRTSSVKDEQKKSIQLPQTSEQNIVCFVQIISSCLGSNKFAHHIVHLETANLSCDSSLRQSGPVKFVGHFAVVLSGRTRYGAKSHLSACRKQSREWFELAIKIKRSRYS
jgi:hypothetical protein